MYTRSSVPTCELSLYLVEVLVFLFQEKLAPYDFTRDLTGVLMSIDQSHPFFSQNSMASSFVANSTCTLDRGSPVDAHPMSGFSQRSWVSNSSTQLWYLWVPDCMAFLAGWYTRTRRVTSSSAGCPLMALRSSHPSTVMVPGTCAAEGALLAGRSDASRAGHGQLAMG